MPGLPVGRLECHCTRNKGARPLSPIQDKAAGAPVISLPLPSPANPVDRGIVQYTEAHSGAFSPLLTEEFVHVGVVFEALRGIFMFADPGGAVLAALEANHSLVDMNSGCFKGVADGDNGVLKVLDGALVVETADKIVRHGGCGVLVVVFGGEGYNARRRSAMATDPAPSWSGDTVPVALASGTRAFVRKSRIIVSVGGWTILPE